MFLVYLDLGEPQGRFQNWSHTEAKNSFNLNAISFESVGLYVWSFIKISSGNVFCAELVLLFRDRKCFHIFLVSF